MYLCTRLLFSNPSLYKSHLLENRIISKPYGNSKSMVTFMHTTTSTLGKFKKMVAPKEIVYTLHNERKGGAFKKLDDIPCKCSKQVYNTNSKSSDNDTLPSDNIMCKESQRKNFYHLWHQFHTCRTNVCLNCVHASAKLCDMQLTILY